MPVPSRLAFITFCLFFNGVFTPARAQQCTLPSHIYLPTADAARAQQYGSAVDVDGQYMVSGVPNNSSYQVYSGVALVYKLNALQQWEPIAELSPSVPGKYRNFGEKVQILGNTIVVHATEYNDDGLWRTNLYVFEKGAGEWTSATESYMLSKPFGVYPNLSAYGHVALKQDEMIAVVRDQGVNRIEVYRRTAGQFTVAQVIPMPVGTDNDTNIEASVVAADDFFAVGDEQFDHQDGSTGAVFVYEKTGAVYETTPSVLKAAEQTRTNWRGFGIDIALHGSTLFIRGAKNTGTDYRQVFYIVSRPAGGWADAQPAEMLEGGPFVYYYSQLVANENYLFTVNGDFNGLEVFKKNGSTWTAGATHFTIADLPVGDSMFGWQVALNDQHLVIGCPFRWTPDGAAQEFIFDYYHPTGTWENRDMDDTHTLRHTALNAADDFFGEEFSVYNGQLAITASGDDERGLNTGVVYVYFNAEERSDTPDQKIYNPQHENSTAFGEGLAMGDSVMFIGAPGKDSVAADGTRYHNVGRVYVYRLTAGGWEYSSQIAPPSLGYEIWFGRTVAWSKGYCAVTEFYSGSSESVGRVHIFKENAGSGKFEYLATLDPAEHQRSDFFGQHMLMTDSMMVIGTGYIAPSVWYRNSVYIFMKKGEWTSTTEDARLMASDTGWNDRYGASVSMYGDYIVVGAPHAPGYLYFPRDYLVSGAVYIYKRPRRGWKGLITEMAKLTPSDPMELGTFGTSVAIDHNDIFVGSPNVFHLYNVTDNLTNYDNQLKPGSVYHFEKQGREWVSSNNETRKLQSFEPEYVDGYGARMYVSDRLLLVGAHLDDTRSGFRSGSVQTMRQLPAFDAAVFCVDEAPRKLLGFPKGGQWSGTGVNATTGMFDPALAGVGTHPITYQFQGCQTTLPIEVLPDVMVIIRQSPAEQTRCAGQRIPIVLESGEDPANYTWYFRASASEPYTRVDSMRQSIEAPQAGHYLAVVSRGACSPYRQEFVIHDDPAVDIDLNPMPLVCNPFPTGLIFSPAGGTWTGNGMAAHGAFDPRLAGNGVHNAVYTVTTPGGCVWKDSIQIPVDLLLPPSLQYNGDPICGSSDQATLTLTNVDNRSVVEWFRDGTSMGRPMAPEYVARTGGQYMARVTKGTCAQETSPVEVAFEDIRVVFDISLICSDAVTELNVWPPGGTWSGAGITAAGLFDPAPLDNGVYRPVYTVTTAAGCTWQDAAYVPVDKLVQPVLYTNTETVCRDIPATLTLAPVDERCTIVWQSDNNQSLPGGNAASIAVDVPGTYRATVSKGSCTLASGDVTLVPIPHSLFVPNVFTVNGDQANDTFEVRAEGLDNFHMMVYNRYGQVVYETTDVGFHWSGSGASSGIYYWRATYRSCANTREAYTGWVHLMNGQ